MFGEAMSYDKAGLVPGMRNTPLPICLTGVYCCYRNGSESVSLHKGARGGGGRQG